MSMLYAPWRQDYVTKKNREDLDGCVFCNIIASKDDDEQLIIKRYDHCILIFNKYPYAAGHLLVIPTAHGSTLADFTQETLNEIMEVTKKAVEALSEVIKPHAFNIGCNLGKSAGAGIPEHMHQHIVPRWNGDTGFLSLISQTGVISVDLKELHKKLIAAIQ
jgi:ATP adenylyltransferase